MLEAIHLCGNKGLILDTIIRVKCEYLKWFNSVERKER